MCEYLMGGCLTALGGGGSLSNIVFSYIFNLTAIQFHSNLGIMNESYTTSIAKKVYLLT